MYHFAIHDNADFLTEEEIERLAQDNVEKTADHYEWRLANLSSSSTIDEKKQHFVDNLKSFHNNLQESAPFAIAHYEDNHLLMLILATEKNDKYFTNQIQYHGKNLGGSRSWIYIPEFNFEQKNFITSQGYEGFFGFLIEGSPMADYAMNWTKEDSEKIYLNTGNNQVKTGFYQSIDLIEQVSILEDGRKLNKFKFTYA